MKKALCLLLSVMLAFATCSTAFASNYADLISGILDDMSTNNAKCTGAPQQSANGLYRCVELAAIIAMINQ